MTEQQQQEKNTTAGNCKSCQKYRDIVTQDGKCYSCQWKPHANTNPEVIKLAQQPNREKKHYYCLHCNADRTRARVTTPEMYSLGYRGELTAEVCLTCGNW